MKSIKEKAVEYAKTKHTNQNLIEIVSWDFEAGANYALDAIEEFMDNKYFGSNEAEMFYKDLKANIHKFIEQLKGNQ